MKDLHTLEKYRLTDDERCFYGGNGDSGKGMFKVHINGRSFKVVATSSGSWEYVSVIVNPLEKPQARRHQRRRKRRGKNGGSVLTKPKTFR